MVTQPLQAKPMNFSTVLRKHLGSHLSSEV
jgi:hypothetical protein